MDWIVVFIESIFESICESWFYFMQWIVPEKMKNQKYRCILKFLIAIYSIALMICMFYGIIYLCSNEERTEIIGKCLLFIPLVISVLQIFAGILMRVKNKK